MNVNFFGHQLPLKIWINAGQLNSHIWCGIPSASMYNFVLAYLENAHSYKYVVANGKVFSLSGYS